MADQQKSDLVMKFLTKENTPVYAECALGKDKNDAFLTDFNPQTYDSYSDFFEVSKFGFGFEVKDEDDSKSKLSGDKDKGTKYSKKAKSGLVQGEFASWRSATDAQAPNVTYPLELDSFRFERLIDAASPVFFKHCCDSKSFLSATLVKRVSTGGDHGPVGFLRIDFKDVLITSLSWDDGDMTTEKCEFICRDFWLRYKQQKADGSLGPMAEAKWNYIKDAISK